MARKPSDVIGVTLRVREHLRRRLEREAKKNDVSLNAEIEQRLEHSFELANIEALIKVLVGGGLTAELLGAIAKVFELGGPLRDESKKRETAYIALILIFTELLSTQDEPLDPELAGAVVSAQRKRQGLKATNSQMDGLWLAQNVLTRAGVPSMFEVVPEVQDPAGGYLHFPKRKRKGGKT